MPQISSLVSPKDRISLSDYVHASMMQLPIHTGSIHEAQGPSLLNEGTLVLVSAHLYLVKPLLGLAAISVASESVHE